MDCEKIGELICALRRERGMTQRSLAERLNVSDKAVSKWERGLGCPDVSLLPELSETFGVNLEEFLSGRLEAKELVGGNMKKLKFYVCPVCKNLITATGEASVCCCGKKLQPLTPQKAAEDERLNVEQIEQDYFITTEHEMAKEHYITFVAFLTGDSMTLRQLYPEWNMQVRLPRRGHGLLVYNCSRHGLFWQPL